MRLSRRLWPFVFVSLVAASGCAAGPNTARVSVPYVAGFWRGLWHGIIIPVTFFISLFAHSVNVYEVHNNGNWYNFGFVLGISMAFGSGARGARRHK